MEARLAGMFALNVAIPVCFVTATSAATGKKVIGANDIDQVEEDAPNRAAEGLEATGVWWNALGRRVQCHRACSDAEEPVCKRRDARVEAHVSDWNVYRDRTEGAEHERASAGSADLLRAGIRQCYTTP